MPGVASRIIAPVIGCGRVIGTAARFSIGYDLSSITGSIIGLATAIADQAYVEPTIAGDL